MATPPVISLPSLTDALTAFQAAYSTIQHDQTDQSAAQQAVATAQAQLDSSNGKLSTDAPVLNDAIDMLSAVLATLKLPVAVAPTPPTP